MTEEETRKKWNTAQRMQAMYICPNTGKLIDTSHGDDKVCCYCTSAGTHHVKGLKKATYEDFVKLVKLVKLVRERSA